MKTLFGFLRPAGVMAAALLLTFSCTDDITDNPDLQPQVGEQASVELNYSVEAMQMGGDPRAATRVSPSDLPEANPSVKGIWIIQFNGTAADSPMIGAPRYVVPTGASFAVPLTTVSATVNTLFVANLPQGAGYSWSLLPGAKFSDVTKAVELIGAEAETYETMDGDKTLIMSAVVASPVDPGTPINVVFKRNVAKISLSLTLSNADMTIKSVRVRRVSNRINYADQAFTVAGVAFPQDIVTLDYAAHTSDMPTNGTTETFSWYVPRNMQGTATASVSSKSKNEYAPVNATYIEIQATKGTTSPSVSIFRIYPGANDVDNFDLKGNTHYTYALNVKDIGTDPSDSRVESFALLVDHSTYDAGKRANSFIINPAPAGSGVVRTYRIPVTQVNTYWTGTADGYGNTPANALSASDEWTVSLIWVDRQNLFTSGRIELGNTGYGTGGGIGVEVNAVAKTGYFELIVPDAGVLADAGLVAGNFTLGLKKGLPGAGDWLWSWHFWVTDYNPDEFNRATAPVMRENKIYTSVVPGGQIERYEGAYWQVGYENADRVMMDRNLGAVETFFTNPFGGDNRGILHYQFGRKDPFPASALATNTPAPAYSGSVPRTNGVVPIASSVTHPAVFNVIPTWGNWTTDALGTNYRWNDPTPSLTGKSIYDPCPPGWQLPINGTWNDFNRQVDGQYANSYNAARDLAYNYGQGIGSVTTPVRGIRYWPGTTGAEPVTGRIWFPTTGLRNAATGVIGSVGDGGYYWSSTPNNAPAGYQLRFMTNLIIPNNSDSRSYGFAVRCISE